MEFTVLQHVSVPIDCTTAPYGILCSTWCPTMDLLSIITTDHILYVYRLNWQLLFQMELPNDNEYCCIQWRKDGKAVYITCVNGVVLHVSVELHSILYQQVIGDSIIYDMQLYVQKQSESNKHGLNISLKLDHNTTARLYPLLPVLPKPVSLVPSAVQPSNDVQKCEIDVDNCVGSSVITDASKIYDNNNTLQLSVTLSNHSIITILSYNTLSIVQLNLHTLLQIDDAVISSVVLNNECTQLHVCYTHAHQLLQTTIDTSILQQRSHELSYCTIQYQSIDELIQYTQQCLKLIQSNIKYIQRQLEVKFDPLHDVLHEHHINSTVELRQSHLYTLLCTGIPSTILQEFIQRFLSAQSLLKTKSNIDLHYIKINDIIQLVLLPVCKQLLHRINELGSCAQWYDRYSQIGVHIQHYKQMIQYVQALILKLNDVQQHILQSRSNICAFMLWFIPYVRIIANEHDTNVKQVDNDIHYELDSVVQCIQHNIFNDSVDEYFVNDRLSNVLPSHITEPNNDILSDILEPLDIDYSTVTVKHILELLNNQITAAKQTISDTITHDTTQQYIMSCIKSTILLNDYTIHNNLLPHSNTDAGALLHHTYTACQQITSSDNIHYTVYINYINTVPHIMARRNNDVLTLAVDQLCFEDVINIVQVVFYKDNILGVLIQHSQNNDNKPESRLYTIDLLHTQLQYNMTISLNDLYMLELDERIIRCRKFPNTSVHSMSLCGTRGIGSIYTLNTNMDINNQLPSRVIIIDLVDDEEIERKNDDDINDRTMDET